MRRDSREAVYKILYADLYYENDREFEKETIDVFNFSPENKAFENSLLTTIKEHKEKI